MLSQTSVLVELTASELIESHGLSEERLASLAVAFTPVSGTWKTWRVVLGMVGKCFATGTMESLNCWTIEIFPTDVRSRGMGFVQVISCET